MTETHIMTGDYFFTSWDTCYVDSANPNTNYQGYDMDLYSSSTVTRMGLMTFRIPKREILAAGDLGGTCSNKAYLHQVKIKLDVSNAGASLWFYPLNSSHTSTLDFDFATYSRPGIIGDDSNIKWNPDNWAHATHSDTSAPVVGGNRIGVLTCSSTGVKTLDLEAEALETLGADFGSTVYLAFYATSSDNIVIDLSDSTIEIVTKETKPDFARISSTKTSDGLSANITVNVPNDDSITEYYLESSTSSVSATASGDYIQGSPPIDGTEVVPMSSIATLAQGVPRYVKAFTENDDHTNTGARGGTQVILFRPKIDASGAVLYTDSALSSALDSGEENITLGQKVYLKVTNAAVSTPTGNKYTKIRVNWDSGTSDTDEDYSTYDMVDLTPVLNNASNTVVSHIYHSAGAKVVKVQVEDENGYRSDKGNITGNQPNVKTGFPTAIISPSRTKVTTAKYGDRTTAITLSGQQSRTSGSDIVVENYGWGYTATLATTIVTANALENNNTLFNDNSKRVKIASLANVDVDDTVFKIFGLASFGSDGVSQKDTVSAFDHYAYTSATASPLTFDEDARPNIGGPAIDSNDQEVYFKEIECVVCTTKAANEDKEIYDCQRYVLVTNAADEDSSASQVINSDLRYDSNVAASLVDSGDDVGETYTATDEVLTRSSSTVTDHPEVIRIDNEDLFVHHESSNDVLVHRGYNGTTAAAHASGAAINVYRLPSRYRWGGYAMVQGTNIDFNDAGTIDIGDGLFDENCSAGDEKDWFAQGFYIGDIIKVGNDSGSNGTFDDPKYYKIKTITASGASSGNDYDIVTIETNAANLSKKEQQYVSTTLTTDVNELPVILRDDSAKKPSMTAAVYNTANLDDKVTFYMGIFDSTKSRFSAQDKSSTTTNHNFSYHWSEDSVEIQVVTPDTLDLDTLADANNIAIEKVNLTRSGGISSQMPLGIRRYPVGVVRTKLGLPKVAIQVKALTQTGYRALFSLVEGNRYDYVFLDSKKLDVPTTSYRTLRMRLEAGNITKDTVDPNVYLANLSFIILGEDVS